MIRRNWGTILTKKNSEGQVVGWIARYTSPIDRKKISRHFKTEYRAQAENWLDNEHYLVILHHKGIRTWEPPSARKESNSQKNILFEDYLRAYIKNHRKKDGTRLTGSSMRNMLADCGHFLPFFRGKRMIDITTKDISAWYDSDHREGAWGFYGACQVLRAVFRHASTSVDGTPPLLEHNPFVMPVIMPKGNDKSKQQPVSPSEAKLLAEAMPEYTRLSIWLALLVGGLRIGEVCAIQLSDIDLENRLLYVSHSVDRGEHDRGACRLGPTKTPSSNRVVPIPESMVELISKHIHTYCSGRNSMLFPAVRSENHILSPTTLGAHFRKARQAANRPDITFHSLRATHATMVMIKGGTLREAMDELGHTSEKIAIKHYQRIIPSHRKSVVNSIALDYLDSSQTLRLQIEKTSREISELQVKLKNLHKKLEYVESS